MFYILSLSVVPMGWLHVCKAIATPLYTIVIDESLPTLTRVAIILSIAVDCKIIGMMLQGVQCRFFDIMIDCRYGMIALIIIHLGKALLRTPGPIPSRG